MPATRPRRKTGIQSTELDGQCVLHVPGSGDLHVLNATAGAVWELCDGAHSVDDICARLAEEFDAPDPDDLRRDVEEVLRSLSERGLLQ